MSIADVYASAEELMDLKLSPNKQDQLIHPYNQVRSIPNSNRREIRVFNFANGDWNKRNLFVIPSMDLRITELYVEFNLAAETSQSNARWEPTPTWLTLQGADLLYKNKSVINMSEPECLMATVLDNRANVFRQASRLMGFDREVGAANVAVKLYLPLNHLCNQVLSKIGAISAYSSGDWSISVDLRQQLQVLSAASGITAPTSSMTSMRLICVGAKVPPGEIAMQRQALLQNGIVWNFLRSNRFRTTVAVTNIGNTRTTTQTFTSVVGNVSHIRMVSRNKSEWDTTDSSLKNNVDYDANYRYGPNNTISVGRISIPYDVFGDALYTPFLKTFFPKSNLSEPLYLQIADVPNVGGIDTTMVDISFAESLCDMEYGCSTGSYPVKNDLVISSKLAPDIHNTTAHYLDTIIYTHVRGIVTHKDFNLGQSA